MKFINIYTGAALALTGAIILSLAIATGETEPPAIVRALIFMVVVLGRAGGAESARTEVDRLTRIEGARSIQAQCHATERDNLEAEIDRLRAQIKDGQAAIEIFCRARDSTAALIMALEAQNAGLRKWFFSAPKTTGIPVVNGSASDTGIPVSASAGISALLGEVSGNAWANLK
ncbi:hypothetical protein [Janthinobacterium agaricidamnosum]|uniref:Uncharacterized protein n=1 Tax=Janthinobacterium agaricidamnosum NBRC 102515 = DSM 9628 TaxID=1349767 RepID=W0V5P5_9BURK|nr:hypothetical protein [Janthinobacterium agaricidamnosum]CDG84149.1 hypothetical protein GJA_3533 [Janthinobacterium agaricidamnosum NBRC 102515 = DSM 9628]